MNLLDKRIEEKGRPLLGAACYSYDPVFVDMVGALGFDALWVEMEHLPITFAQAGDLCRMASGMGLLTMIRIPDARRENVLKAAECGPSIIDLPMVNSPETARELVLHARFAPQGTRGFFSVTRAMNYCFDRPIAEEQKRVNSELCLMGQIETREAAERADEIVSVEGLNAIFLGPGDMSASFGVPGEISHPLVEQAMESAVQSARRHGRRVAMAIGADKVSHWAAKGVELFFCGSNISCLKSGAQSMRAEFEQQLGKGV